MFQELFFHQQLPHYYHILAKLLLLLPDYKNLFVDICHIVVTSLPDYALRSFKFQVDLMLLSNIYGIIPYLVFSLNTYLLVSRTPFYINAVCMILLFVNQYHVLDVGNISSFTLIV
jgi:hypothetical protein